METIWCKNFQIGGNAPGGIPTIMDYKTKPFCFAVDGKGNIVVGLRVKEFK